MLKRFNKIFGIQDLIDEGKRKFVNRINQELFEHCVVRNDTTLLRKVYYQLGEDYYVTNPLSIDKDGLSEKGKLTIADFMGTLKAVCCIYEYSCDAFKNEINHILEEVFSLSLVDLGVRWEKGMFYPSGAKELDEKLIEEPLEWLTDYPDERKDFQKAIECYTGKKYDDVIQNCYLTIEGISRKTLNNKKTLDNNCEELFKKIGLSQEWKSFLKNFINYANEFKRHASDERHKVNPIEVEAFLYQTGLFVRLIIEFK